jgi:hypothetical protein
MVDDKEMKRRAFAVEVAKSKEEIEAMTDDLVDTGWRWLVTNRHHGVMEEDIVLISRLQVPRFWPATFGSPSFHVTLGHDAHSGLRSGRAGCSSCSDAGDYYYSSSLRVSAGPPVERRLAIRLAII